ncbi:MAG: hypothetical protein OXU77_05125 [Gammaproteobacteria bacterium]|nr:hypothetical protein [Gammaproteobacteria bacterium]MDE0442873.1 hypothetical protein [Gammaproteobacteria bacterium]
MTDPLETVLSQLDRWRHLPKYRLEQHVDVLFGLTLPTVIGRRFNIDSSTLDVIPEFPIHHRTAGISGKNNQSSNVDFAVFSKGGERVFLVELKTDVNSIKNKQLDRMRKTRGKFRCLVNAVRTIAEHSPQKQKYLHLIFELHQVGAMHVNDELRKLDPCQRLSGFTSALRRCLAKDTVQCTPTLVLVHPCQKELADMVKNKNLCTRHFCCIDFKQYAAKLDREEGMEAALAQHLAEWRTPAGKVKPRWRQ